MLIISPGWRTIRNKQTGTLGGHQKRMLVRGNDTRLRGCMPTRYLLHKVYTPQVIYSTRYIIHKVYTPQGIYSTRYLPVGTGLLVLRTRVTGRILGEPKTNHYHPMCIQDGIGRHLLGQWDYGSKRRFLLRPNRSSRNSPSSEALSEARVKGR